MTPESFPPPIILHRRRLLLELLRGAHCSLLWHAHLAKPLNFCYTYVVTMSYQRFQSYFFIGVLAASVILTLTVFWPYLTMLAFGGVFAVLARPLHHFLLGKLRSETAAAFLTVIIGVSGIVLPSIFFFAALTSE